jgi:hypothetical protein
MFLTLDQSIAVFSAAVSFLGLFFVGIQMRESRKQRETESLIQVLDVNRQLVILGFSHPQLFKILEGDKTVEPLLERYYLQLWLNQFSLIHSYFRNSFLKGERKENLERDLSDVMLMPNMQKHWHQFGKFYPASFQNYINGILKESEPPKSAAHLKR